MAAPIVVASAFGAAPTQRSSRLEMALSAVRTGDADGDGALDLGEWRRQIARDGQFAAAAFELVDTDNDGLMDAEPWFDLEGGKKGSKGKATITKVTFHFSAKVDNVFSGVQWDLTNTPTVFTGASDAVSDAGKKAAPKPESDTTIELTPGLPSLDASATSILKFMTKDPTTEAFFACDKATKPPDGAKKLPFLGFSIFKDPDTDTNVVVHAMWGDGTHKHKLNFGDTLSMSMRLCYGTHAQFTNSNGKPKNQGKLDALRVEIKVVGTQKKPEGLSITLREDNTGPHTDKPLHFKLVYPEGKSTGRKNTLTLVRQLSDKTQAVHQTPRVPLTSIPSVLYEPHKHNSKGHRHL